MKSRDESQRMPNKELVSYVNSEYGTHLMRISKRVIVHMPERHGKTYFVQERYQVLSKRQVIDAVIDYYGNGRAFDGSPDFDYPPDEMKPRFIRKAARRGDGHAG